MAYRVVKQIVHKVTAEARHRQTDRDGQTDRRKSDFNSGSFTTYRSPKSRVWTHRLEGHSVGRIFLRQRCFDASKPRVAAATGTQYLYDGVIFPT